MKKFLAIFFLLSFVVFAGPLPVKKAIFAARQPQRFEVHPNLSFNTKTKQTLVVWERHPGNHPGHSTWGRLIGPQGTASGSAFQIISGPNTYFPSAVYDAVRNEFGLTFSNEPRSHFVVYFQKLNPKGRPIGNAVQVSEDDPNSALINDFPDIVFNSGTGNYIIFWLRNGPDAGLYGAILRNDLSFVKRGVFIKRSVPEGNSHLAPTILDIEYHASTGKIVCFFYQYRPGFTTTTTPEFDYYLVFLNGDLSGIQPSNFRKINQKVVTGSPTGQLKFLPDGTGIVAYQDSNNVKLRKISSALKMPAASYSAFNSPLSNQKLSHPVIAFTNGKGIVLAVQDAFNNENNGTIWAQSLDAKSQPVGSPFAIERNFDQMGGQDIVALPVNATSTQHRFVSIYVQGVQQNIPPASTESSGLILLNFGFTD